MTSRITVRAIWSVQRIASRLQKLALFCFFAMFTFAAALPLAFASTSCNLAVVETSANRDLKSPNSGSKLLDTLLIKFQENPNPTYLEINSIIQESLLSSFVRMEEALNYLTRNDGKDSLDTEIIEIIRATSQIIDSHQSVMNGLNRKIRAAMNDTEIKQIFDEISLCALHATVCGLRMNLKIQTIETHLSGMIDINQQLHEDYINVNLALLKLNEVSVDSYTHSRIFEALSGFKEQMEVLVGRITSHVTLVEGHVSAAGSYIDSIKGNYALIENIRARKPDLTWQEISESELQARAREMPLSLKQLQIIEKFKNLKLDENLKLNIQDWMNLTQELREIKHWRATGEILRLLQIFDFKKYKKYRKENFITKRLRSTYAFREINELLKKSVYSPELDETILNLSADNELTHFIYSNFVSVHSSPLYNGLALRLTIDRNVPWGLLFERNFSDRDLDIIEASLNKSPKISPYGHENALHVETTTLAKVISKKSIMLMDKAISLFHTDDHYGRPNTHQKLIATRDLMVELLDTFGPHSRETPVVYDLYEINLRRKTKEQVFNDARLPLPENSVKL